MISEVNGMWLKSSKFENRPKSNDIYNYAGSADKLD